MFFFFFLIEFWKLEIIEPAFAFRNHVVESVGDILTFFFFFFAVFLWIFLTCTAAQSKWENFQRHEGCSGTMRGHRGSLLVSTQPPFL